MADCTNQTWTDRHAGARETLSQLQADEAILEQRCRPFHVDLFRELLAELDGYATSIEALLIGRPRFPLGDDGRLDIDSGTEQACERRRKRIEELVSQLLDPFMAPLSDESWQFVRAPTLEARPSVVHRKKHEMRGWSDLRREKAADHHDSPWELDRIVAYLVQLEQPPAEAGDLLAAANGEVNRAYRDDSSRPPMILYYALRAIEETLASGPVDRDVSRGIQGLIARLEGPDAKVTEDRAEFQFGEVLARLHQHLTRGADASDGHDVGEPRASASPGAAATPLAPGP